jgi:CDI immunity protein
MWPQFINRKKCIYIEALSGAGALAYNEDNSHGIYLEPEATNEVLGRALLTAFDRSRFVDPSSEREFYNPERGTRLYKEWQQEFMAHHGYKSKRTTLIGLDWCFARRSEGKISIRPNKRDKPGSWRSLPPEQTVVIPTTEDAATVGAALRLALDRCE